jgi:hypothetical protein
MENQRKASIAKKYRYLAIPEDYPEDARESLMGARKNHDLAAKGRAERLALEKASI